MLLILEANEGGGKTSIANGLLERHPDWILCKRWTHKLDNDKFGFGQWDLREAFFYDWRFFLEMLTYDHAFDKHTFVCDRSFITDYVFNKAIWPEHMTERYMQCWEAYNKQLQTIPHLVIYCKRSIDKNDFNDIAMHNWSMDAEHWQRLEQAYKDWRAETSLHVLNVDNDWYDIDSNVEFIDAYLESLNI